MTGETAADVNVCMCSGFIFNTEGDLARLARLLKLKTLFTPTHMNHLIKYKGWEQH